MKTMNQKKMSDHKYCKWNRNCQIMLFVCQGVQLKTVLKVLNSQGEFKHTLHKLTCENMVFLSNFIESKEHRSGVERKQ